jgi:pimeloyl-ACP methyl ester carboxylesterase
VLIDFDADGVRLAGDLRLPERPVGLVAFAHGSGSSRFSARNVFVAESLVQRGFGALLMDLLTPAEEEIDRRTSEYRFDIEMLGRRMTGIVDWLDTADFAAIPVGLFGASTGAAAALIAAAERPERIRAVVSRGGRPDLAAESLPRVKAPTLLLVGEFDEVVVGLNREARTRMRDADVALEIISGATHLFEEPGALHVVAERAAAWFHRHLPASHVNPERTQQELL